MGSFSIWHILVLLAVVLVLFGRGKIPQVMDDLGKGIKSFKAALHGGENTADKSEPEKLPPKKEDKVG